jgi:choline dehydrogenase-like flavoprotein
MKHGVMKHGVMKHGADYVIAGACSAGCVLARRLAQTGASVILLEAGGPDRTRLKVVIAKGRATGVEVVTKDGPGAITASREVILCAGVYGSPQLLMLSGVDPAASLREHGLDVVADVPVGDHLHDHMFRREHERPRDDDRRARGPAD